MATAALSNLLVYFEDNVTKILRSYQNFDPPIDLRCLVDASNYARMESIATLDDISMRIAKAASSSQKVANASKKDTSQPKPQPDFSSQSDVLSLRGNPRLAILRSTAHLKDQELPRHVPTTILTWADLAFMIGSHSKRAFCSGARKLQQGLQHESFKIQAPNSSMSDQSLCWACVSPKCAFNGPSNSEGKTWAFDDTIYEKQRVRYRWSFLAKCHVKSETNGKTEGSTYVCTLCNPERRHFLRYQSEDMFLEHVASHAGQRLYWFTAQNISFICGRVALAREFFDINFPSPVDGVGRTDHVELAPVKAPTGHNYQLDFHGTVKASGRTQIPINIPSMKHVVRPIPRYAGSSDTNSTCSSSTYSSSICGSTDGSSMSSGGRSHIETQHPNSKIKCPDDDERLTMRLDALHRVKLGAKGDSARRAFGLRKSSRDEVPIEPEIDSRSKVKDRLKRSSQEDAESMTDMIQAESEICAPREHFNGEILDHPSIGVQADEVEKDKLDQLAVLKAEHFCIERNSWWLKKVETLLIGSRNIRIIASFTFFFLPLTFAFGIYVMIAIDSRYSPTLFGNIALLACFPILVVFALLNTIVGPEFWTQTVGSLFTTTFRRYVLPSGLGPDKLSKWYIADWMSIVHPLSELLRLRLDLPKSLFGRKSHSVANSRLRLWKSLRVLNGHEHTTINTIKRYIEYLTGATWDWWPLEPSFRPLQLDEVRVKWECVSDNVLVVQRECALKPNRDWGTFIGWSCQGKRFALCAIHPRHLCQGRGQ